ncbi:MAG TPA: tetratricopeptide repeat protein [Chloroflexota bacterium]|jgi:tetratricopeptide (TPR) repeat protein|nr:tetratricopeptide repeat protein [Chloroflexota bacterium]
MSPAKRLGGALVLAALLSTVLGVAGAVWPAGAGRLSRPLEHFGQRPNAPVPAPRPGERTDRLVESLQLRLRQTPHDQRAYVQLGSAYLQKVRETGDPTYYVKAEGALARALALRPDDAEALGAMGALALGRHDFEGALAWARQALAHGAGRAATYGVLGDALLELGRYDEAIEAFQRMVDLRPDLASYARVSYARELFGDLEGAIEAMELAVAAGGPATERTAWARVQLGQLHFARGDMTAAEGAYLTTLQGDGSYVPARAALGRLRAAEGKYLEAIELLTAAVQVSPLPEYVILLGDVYRATGNTAAAAQQDDLVRVMAALQRANGVELDLEMALFEAERAAQDGNGEAIAGALQTAQEQYARRPSIQAAGILAWTLHLAGQPEEALPLARESLRLGGKDALMLFHAGAIAAGAGQVDEARTYLEAALSQNPVFHVRYAAEAKALLNALAPGEGAGA